ncbi:MAG TPA: hypothetical protein VFA02_01850 [Pseudacidobacterium sp.]|jgi:hypothetical protein|nr:hypothetical protein [Pseudacidobacterium sp.]
MLSLLASGFQVEHFGNGRLMIVNPPVMWVSVTCYVFAVIGLLLLLSGINARSRSTGVMGALLLVCFALLGWTTSVPSTAVLDKDAGLLRIHIGWAHVTSTYPLQQVKYATVESTTAAYRLVFVLDDGHRVGLGSYSDQQGQPEAAHAINQFLGANDIQP